MDRMNFKREKALILSIGAELLCFKSGVIAGTLSSSVRSFRFKNLGFSQLGILSWGNLRTPNSHVNFSVVPKPPSLGKKRRPEEEATKSDNILSMSIISSL